MDLQSEQLVKMIQEAKDIVFLGGAGVSTESGIPDFRSQDGIFKAIREFGYPPETLLSHTFFMRHPEIFYQYYLKYLIFPDVLPNSAHLALARLEWGSAEIGASSKPKGKLRAVITQNIDNLHQKAGSSSVLELHGSVYRNYCMKCGKFYSVETLVHLSQENSDGIPRCSCGGVIKPDVVLYEEGLNQEILKESIKSITTADLMIIGGTSLMVYPAAGLCDYFHGKNIVVLNLSETAKETGADLVIHRPIGEVLKEVVSVLKPEDMDK